MTSNQVADGIWQHLDQSACDCMIHLLEQSCSCDERENTVNGLEHSCTHSHTLHSEEEQSHAPFLAQTCQQMLHVTTLTGHHFMKAASCSEEQGRPDCVLQQLEDISV